jgi:hypothetical protein
MTKPEKQKIIDAYRKFRGRLMDKELIIELAHFFNLYKPEYDLLKNGQLIPEDINQIIRHVNNAPWYYPEEFGIKKNENT